MKNTKLRNLFGLLVNMAVIILTIYSVSRYFVGVGDGNMQVSGFTCFRYFTVLSNVFAAITSIMSLLVNIKSIYKDRECLSHGMMLFRFTSTVAVAVTLVTVLVFLGPAMGYDKMFVGSNLFLHMICPLLAIASFCFLERGGKVERRETIWGVLSVFVYGTIYLIVVVKYGIWPDFYGFNQGGRWYISYPCMLVGAFLLSVLISAIHNYYLKTSISVITNK